MHGKCDCLPQATVQHTSDQWNACSRQESLLDLHGSIAQQAGNEVSDLEQAQSFPSVPRVLNSTGHYAVQQVVDAITARVKDGTPLLRGVPVEDKLLLEHSLRLALMHLAEAAAGAGQPLMAYCHNGAAAASVPRLLDLALWLSQHKQTEFPSARPTPHPWSLPRVSLLAPEPC